MKAYVLVFDTGEYSDRTERIVCVYGDPNLAHKHCDLANQWLKDRGIHFDNNETGFDGPKRHELGPTANYRGFAHGLRCPFDPDLDGTDYTGGMYTITEVCFGTEDSLSKMQHADDNTTDWLMFADWVEEYGWSKEANKFRQPQGAK